MPSTFSPNKNYELQATGENNGTWGIKADADFSMIDLNFGGRFNVSVAGSSNVVVNAAQAQNVRHVLTGLLTGNINYSLPNAGSFYIITNNTTGSFTVTVKNTGGGGGFGIPQGSTVICFVNPDTPDVTVVAGPQSASGQQLWGGTSGGSANAQTVTLPAVPLGGASGIQINFKAGFTSTAAATLNVNGTGAVALQMDGLALSGGEIQAGSTISVIYDGASYQIVSTRSQSAIANASYRKNRLINGGGNVNQRSPAGVSVPIGTSMVAWDRWYAGNGANQLGSAGTSGDIGDRLPNALFFIRNAGQTGTTGMFVGQTLDTDMLYPLRGQRVTCSGFVLTTANFSSATVGATLFSGTGAPQKRTAGGGFTGSVTVGSQSIAASPSTLLFFTFSGSVPGGCNQMELDISWTPVGTAGASDGIIWGGWQLEPGNDATQFEQVPFEQEIGLCRSYFWKSFTYDTTPAQNAGVAGALPVSQFTGASNAQASTSYTLPSFMRTNGAATIYNPSAANAQIRNISRNTNWTSSAGSAGDHSINFTGVSAAGSAAGDQSYVHVTIDSEI